MRKTEKSAVSGMRLAELLDLPVTADLLRTLGVDPASAGNDRAGASDDGYPSSNRPTP